MKKLTKATLRKVVKDNIATGLTISEACSCAVHEFEMYAAVICSIEMELLQKEMGL